MNPDFAVSDFGSLGVEYESTVIDRATSRPLPLAGLLAAQSQSHYSRGTISADLFEPTLEFTTGICSSLDEARTDLTDAYGAVRPLLDQHGAELLGMGLAPSATVDDFPLLPDTRYQEISTTLQWPALQVTTNGIHVHVGMPSLDRALRTATALRSTLPLLLALSASSPFRAGEVTGLASTRMSLWSAIPRSGQMPDFADVTEYSSYVNAMAAANAISDTRDLRWDSRLNATYGTLEIRLTETVSDLDDVMALVALAWCMVVGIDHLEGFTLPRTMSDENRWRAMRYGSGARMMADSSGKTESLDTFTTRVIEALETTAVDLGCTRDLARCLTMARGEAAHQKLTVNADGRAPQELIGAAESTMRVRW